MARRNRLTPKGRPSSAPFKRSGNTVTNRFGVTITEKQLTELRARARAANRFLVRRNNTIRTNMKKYLPKGATPVIDTYSLFAPKSASFNKFRTKAEFNAYMRRLSYFYDRNTRESGALNVRANVNYNNFMKALDKVAGAYSETTQYQNVVSLANQIGKESLLNAMESYAVENVGYVYYSYEGVMDKLKTLEMELYDYANRLNRF